MQNCLNSKMRYSFEVTAKSIPQQLPCHPESALANGPDIEAKRLTKVDVPLPSSEAMHQQPPSRL